ncbi:hypothetical protein MAPG_11124 [Magnaporthiopsis poae ATCC 64411]|uniref:Uncharacterized protein n=1 Tax=Magnaporthiopsis poae (strain ATCC 64411 / 73-15) TaxID=644358 RepID=A0A0C4EEF1_MAGP6|nr:hypothetical protein MAPG_11124 [Magnaporthiopsis poae ATCC 64411]
MDHGAASHAFIVGYPGPVVRKGPRPGLHSSMEISPPRSLCTTCARTASERATRLAMAANQLGEQREGKGPESRDHGTTFLPRPEKRSPG